MRSSFAAALLVSSLVDCGRRCAFCAAATVAALLLLVVAADAQEVLGPETIVETMPVYPPDQLPTIPIKTGPAGGFSGFLQAVQVDALGDAYYDSSPNGSKTVALRNFDEHGGRMSISMAKFDVLRSPTADERFGFRVDVHAGPATALIHASEPATSEVLHHLEQAFASYLAPVGKGLQIDVGEFVTPHGAEVIEARDNWNYSRSLLFALAIPYYHMGVRAAYAFSDRFSLAGGVVNGWNDIVDNNAGKTYSVQMTVKPLARLSIVQNYMAGPEQAHDNRDWRHLADTVVTGTLTSRWSVMANYDYGRDSIAGVPIHWQGIAAYAKYQATPRLAVSPRVEWYDDPAGFTTGTPQQLREVTATGEVKLGRGFLWRLEWRHDRSGTGTFVTPSGELVNGQTTVGTSLLYSFSSRAGAAR